jgi:hypothetical protein
MCSKIVKNPSRTWFVVHPNVWRSPMFVLASSVFLLNIFELTHQLRLVSDVYAAVINGAWVVQ